MTGKRIISVIRQEITLYLMIKGICSPVSLKNLINGIKYTYKKVKEFYNLKDNGKKPNEGLRLYLHI